MIIDLQIVLYLCAHFPTIVYVKVTGKLSPSLVLGEACFTGQKFETRD
jgi:hypothetical protein